MRLIEAAILETIERCAQVCEDMAAAPWNYEAASPIALRWHAARKSGQRHAATMIRDLKKELAGHDKR